MAMTTTATESSSSAPPEAAPTSAGVDDDSQQRSGVIGWVKGKIQKRNIAANMNNINLDDVQKNAMAAAEGGEPSDLDIAMGLGNGGVVDPDEKELKNEDRIDLEAENNEGLLVGWGKKLHEVEWVQKTVEVVQKEVTNQKEQAELREIHEKYKEEIKKDKSIKELNSKIRKIKKNLKVQRLNGDRIGKRNSFARNKEQAALDQNTVRLQKAIWTFANSSMNSHEYAKAMMRASARLKRKGVNVHKSEKALALEAAVLRNMHRMLAIQKQYTMSKRACNDVSSFIKRCKGWLDNKLADGEMCIMVLEATSKSREILYQEVVEIQEGLIPKFDNPRDYTFGKPRLKTVLALPKGLRSMPTFLKGPTRPPMKISLTKKTTEDNEDPNLRGYRTFKEQGKAMEKAWKEELAQYESKLEVGGAGFKPYEDDDISDIGDSEDEIEEMYASVSMAAAAAKKSKKETTQIDLAEMAIKQGAAPDREEQAKVETFPESAEEADAAALQQAEKTAGEQDPDVDEAALPDEVKKEDLEKLLNKEAEEVAEVDAEGSDNNAVEEGLHQVVEDALAGVDAEADDVSDDDEGPGDGSATATKDDDDTAISC